MVHHWNSDASLFRSVQTCLANLVMRRGVPACECDDCTQESWLALAERHSEWALDDPRTLPFLVGVARNKANDFHRQRKRRRTCQFGDLLPIPAFESVHLLTAPDSAGGTQTVISKIQDGLDRLKEVNRDIFIQHVYGGRTYRQIGECLGIAPKRVKIRYHRIRSRLLRRCERSRKNALGGGKSHCWKSGSFPVDRPHLYGWRVWLATLLKGRILGQRLEENFSAVCRPMYFLEMILGACSLLKDKRLRQPTGFRNECLRGCANRR